MNYSEPFLAIKKEAVAEMPVVEFDGEITVVDTEEEAEKALELLEREEMVGFDTETRPSFRKGVTHKVALIQISTNTHSYLFRINKTGLVDRLKRFIENTSILKIGLSLKDDFFVLHKVSEFVPEGFIDLQSYVTSYGIADASLQKIFAIVFGQRISKAQRLTNWEAPELTEAQQTYASIDAWACLRLYRHLTAGLFIPEESPYRKEESTQEPANDTGI